MIVQANVSGGGVSVSVGGGQSISVSPSQSLAVSASVASPEAQPAVMQTARVSAVVTGGIGPAGRDGVDGAPNRLVDLLDVAVEGASSGDVLRYYEGMWRNYNDVNLTDGGNF